MVITKIKKKKDRYYLSVEFPLIVEEKFFDDIDSFICLMDRAAREAIEDNLKEEALMDAEDTLAEFLDKVDDF